MTEIVGIPAHLLEPCLIQNPKRHETEAAVRAIVDTRDGDHLEILRPLHAVRRRSGTFWIADGHRRWQASIRVNGAKAPLPCIVYPSSVDPYDLYTKLNATTARFGGNDWFYAWATLARSPIINGDRRDLDRLWKGMHTTARGHIGDTVKVFGTVRAIELGLSDQSPSIGRKTLLFYAGLVSRLGELPLTKREVGEWLLDHGTFVIRLIETKPPKKTLQKLVTAMKKGLPFPRSQW